VSDLPDSDGRHGLPLAGEARSRLAVGGAAASFGSATGSTNAVSDDELIGRVIAGELGLFGLLMRRYERRLFRVARSIAPTDGAAEDVLELTFLEAYDRLARFRGQARLSTWLSRIAISVAVTQAHRRSAFARFATRIAGFFDDESTGVGPRSKRTADAALERVERTLSELPTGARTVLVMREVEGMSTAETADCLGMSEESIHFRLLGARAFLHGRVAPVERGRVAHVYEMPLERGARIAERVLARLRSVPG
jgi:RNA polymerase sigma-70 factor (ECF subfamily)